MPFCLSRDLRGPSNVIFGLFVLASAILIFVDSLIFYDFGTRYVAVERLLIFGKLLCAILFCRLVRIETNSDFEVQPYWNQAMAIVLFVTAVVTLAPVSLPTLDLVADAIAVVLIINSIWVARGVSTFQMKIMAVLAAIFVATYLSQFIWPSPGHSLSIIQLQLPFDYIHFPVFNCTALSRHVTSPCRALRATGLCAGSGACPHGPRYARRPWPGDCCCGSSFENFGLERWRMLGLGNLTRSIDDSECSGRRNHRKPAPFGFEQSNAWYGDRAAYGRNAV